MKKSPDVFPWLRQGLWQGITVIEIGNSPFNFDPRNYTAYSMEGRIIMRWGSDNYKKYVADNVNHSTFEIVWFCLKQSAFEN